MTKFYTITRLDKSSDVLEDLYASTQIINSRFLKWMSITSDVYKDEEVLNENMRVEAEHLLDKIREKFPDRFFQLEKAYNPEIFPDKKITIFQDEEFEEGCAIRYRIIEYQDCNMVYPLNTIYKCSMYEFETDTIDYGLPDDETIH